MVLEVLIPTRDNPETVVVLESAWPTAIRTSRRGTPASRSTMITRQGRDEHVIWRSELMVSGTGRRTKGVVGEGLRPLVPACGFYMCDFELVELQVRLCSGHPERGVDPSELHAAGGLLPGCALANRDQGRFL